jgi:hypothetical protein
LRGLTGIARSEYSAFQLSVRKRMSHGLLFNINYTLSHSLDHASTPERFGTEGASIGGTSGFMHNSWNLHQQYGDSDFDMRHQLNAHWVFELPLGRGKHFGSGMPGWADHIIGGWLVSGIFRANSGLPVSIDNGRTWPTNWNYNGNAVCAPRGSYILGLAVGPCPPTKTTKNGPRGPNLFPDPDEAFRHFRHAATGENGGRNQLRGDKYLNFDFGIVKSFRLPKERHRLHFRWDIFNLLNSPYFDTGAINASFGDAGTFGDYRGLLGGPRRMQLTLRYEF